MIMQTPKNGLNGTIWTGPQAALAFQQPHHLAKNNEYAQEEQQE